MHNIKNHIYISMFDINGNGSGDPTGYYGKSEILLLPEINGIGIGDAFSFNGRRRIRLLYINYLSNMIYDV